MGVMCVVVVTRMSSDISFPREIICNYFKNEHLLFASRVYSYKNMVYTVTHRMSLIIFLQSRVINF
jgi:hypothetical protein